MQRIRLCMAAGLVVLAFGACSGGGNERADTIIPPSATPAAAASTPATAGSTATAPSTPTAAASPADTELSKALLTLDDMPTGWTLSTDGPDSGGDTELCGKDPLPGEPRAKVSRDFEKGSFTQATSTVQAWGKGEASHEMQTARQVMSSCTTWTDTDKDGKPETYRLSPLSFPKLGDETLAVRLSLDTSGATVAADAIYIRRGDYITIVGNLAAGFGTAEVDSALTEQLARKADAKLQAFLSR